MDGRIFGDFPYGLEPLTLPMPGEQHGHEVVALDATWQEVVNLAHRGQPAAPAAGRVPADQLAWFRWITGHQLSSAVWRLLADALRRASDEPATTALAAATTYVRGYSALLLYTGSCPREVYEELIRPSMYRHHRWFSGTWAPDYRPVRTVLRGGLLPFPADMDVTALVVEIKLNRHVHAGVAAWLVPDGQSFVAKAITAQDLHRPRLPGPMYDSYFVTNRAPVTDATVTLQILRRVHAVLFDLSNNGLYFRGTPPGADLPAPLRHPAVQALAADLCGTMLRVAGHATGRSMELEPQSSRCPARPLTG